MSKNSSDSQIVRLCQTFSTRCQLLFYKILLVIITSFIFCGKLLGLQYCETKESVREPCSGDLACSIYRYQMKKFNRKTYHYFILSSTHKAAQFFNLQIKKIQTSFCLGSFAAQKSEIMKKRLD